jgi:hypothetical protein
MRRHELLDRVGHGWLDRAPARTARLKKLKTNKLLNGNLDVAEET